MKSNLLLSLLLILAAGLLAACSDNDDNDSPAPASATATTETPAAASEPAPSNSQGLIGTSWLLLNGSRDGVTYSPPVDRPFTFTFESADRLSGFTGCNTFNADYSLDGTSMTIGSIATTLIGCPAPFSLLEQRAVDDFAGSGTAVRNGDRLTLDGDGTTLNFSQQP